MGFLSQIYLETGTVYFECRPLPFVAPEVTRNSVAAYKGMRTKWTCEENGLYGGDAEIRTNSEIYKVSVGFFFAP
jgi:hypothetical protein